MTCGAARRSSNGRATLKPAVFVARPKVGTERNAAGDAPRGARGPHRLLVAQSGADGPRVAHVVLRTAEDRLRGAAPGALEGSAAPGGEADERAEPHDRLVLGRQDAELCRGGSLKMKHDSLITALYTYDTHTRPYMYRIQLL